MSYLAELADAIRNQVDPAALPTGDTASLFRIYAVLALAKGREVTVEDVHNAWVAWMGERDPHHRSIKPFDELPADVRMQDEPFVDAIRAALAKSVCGEPGQGSGNDRGS
jgi:hypothetical protein